MTGILLGIMIFSEELSDDIVIIHLNDVHCGITDKIGYDGFVLYRRELEKKYKKVITVDVGDHIQGGTLGAISDGEAIIKIMNEVNFDVAILGNHEFDYRLAQLHKLGDNITSKYGKNSILRASSLLGDSTIRDRNKKRGGHSE